VKAVFGKCLARATALLLATLSPWAGGAEGGDSAAVWVSLPPQAFVVERIAGPEARVRVLVGPGRSPATYAPTASEAAALARSDLYFGIGVPAERRVLEKMSGLLRSVRVVGPEEWALETRAAEGHAHADGSACMADGEDPHLWMDPQQMKAFAGKVAAELARLRPGAADGFAERERALQAELDALDTSIRERLAPFAGRSFFINHAALGHFAGRYGLEQRSLERFGASPSARRVRDLGREAREAGAGAILVQPQFNRSTAELLARGLGIALLEVDPLAGDYPANLERVAEALVRSFEGKGEEEASAR